MTATTAAGGLHFHALRVADVQPAAADALAVTFEVPPALVDTFRFAAGQYVTLRRGDLRRSYSICAAPGERLRVGVRRVDGGAFSGWLHGALRAGDSLDVLPPQGRFGAAIAARPRHLLAVAAGSGITPILGILKAALDGSDGRCTLVYANRDAASMMFKEEIEDLKNSHLARFAVHAVFSRERVDSPLHAGRVDRQRIGTFLRLAGAVDQAFVCGPHAMNDDVAAALAQAGLTPAQIHVERYGVPPAQRDPLVDAARAGDAAQARIIVVRDGVTRDVDYAPGDGSILAAVVRAGLDVPYSCRSGVCATCRAKLVEGQVRMARNFALEPDDLAAGFVLTCQAHPLTDRVVVSFDER